MSASYRSSIAGSVGFLSGRFSKLDENQLSLLRKMSVENAALLLQRRPNGENIVEIIADRARELARFRRSGVISTVDVLFGVLDVYDRSFDRALYIRGCSREELLERLAAQTPAPV